MLPFDCSSRQRILFKSESKVLTEVTTVQKKSDKGQVTGGRSRCENKCGPGDPEGSGSVQRLSKKSPAVKVNCFPTSEKKKKPGLKKKHTGRPVFTSISDLSRLFKKRKWWCTLACEASCSIARSTPDPWPGGTWVHTEFSKAPAQASDKSRTTAMSE